MPKLLAYMLIAGFVMLLQALQTDQELAIHALFEAKHAVNRSAHAAAQQIDDRKLARGILAIDPAAAFDTALGYLRANMRLDESLTPLGGTFWRSSPEIVRWIVVPETAAFPYHYEDPDYDYEVTLRRPGVILIIRLQYPAVYPLLSPIVWTVGSAHELTPAY
ncbi:hypothetical protein ACFQWB_13785 [Paenibacillus thermoaerophilus]|uniref:Uncharacterized protein n=1 Tax=Paenibacillus thermoaerophilus TaxID=1215385 RepID=A0ABW2V8N9_9BACL|nr:hypothetical protein [Paenibacillus thermoaerophilus]TMV16111.1 hypothetical protein FE781_08550 [Paenibacillus thermoaerophilus]